MILISIDTLRADHVGAYGATSGTTPFLDSLAKDGVLFEEHMSNSNNTLSSHASILSGLVPLAHGTRDGGSPETRFPLLDEVDTLAERMQDGGYTTAAFTAHPAWLGRSFGLDQGFEHLESEWWDARVESKALLRWLDRETPTHLFAFLHFYDVHSDMGGPGVSLPYQSDAECIEKFAGPRPADFSGTVPGKDYQCCSRWLQAANEGVFVPSSSELEYVRGLYDAGLAQLDGTARGQQAGCGLTAEVMRHRQKAQRLAQAEGVLQPLGQGHALARARQRLVGASHLPQRPAQHTHAE